MEQHSTSIVVNVPGPGGFRQLHSPDLSGGESLKALLIAYLVGGLEHVYFSIYW
jgi:hypothetical protein